jgi:hypothetical protein
MKDNLIENHSGISRRIFLRNSGLARIQLRQACNYDF